MPTTTRLHSSRSLRLSSSVCLHTPDIFWRADVSFVAASTDSKYAHFAWASSERNQGGLGPDLKLPLLADPSHKIARDYNVLIEDEGIALRGLFIIDPKGILRQITVNDLPVGRSVDETIRLIKAFQFVVRSAIITRFLSFY